MYIVSQRSVPVPSGVIRQAGQDMRVAFPGGYSRFLQQYGEGTYRGWFCIQAPDPDVLPPFAEYDLWEHKKKDAEAAARLVEQNWLSLGEILTYETD